MTSVAFAFPRHNTIFGDLSDQFEAYLSKFFETFSGTPNPSDNLQFDEVLEQSGRRTVLKAAPVVSVAALMGLPACSSMSVSGPRGPLVGFKPIPPSSADAVTVPEGYKADVLVAWGDPIGDTRGMPVFKFDASNTAEDQVLQSGTHHDGMYFFPLPLGSKNSNHGLLVMNHEYPDNNAMFPDGMANWSLPKVRKSQAALGCSVQEIKLDNGAWQLVKPSRYARRIHANTPMRVGGPAAGSPLMRTSASPTGRESIGTFNNCANGWTPWGTYLTCEENFSFHFKASENPSALEERYELSPKVRFSFRWGEVDARFDMTRNRNEPNHFGWVVEFDPYEPGGIPAKRTALGRFSHEGACHAECKDGRIAIYSGDDRGFEYIYKFVSSKTWNKLDRAANRDLLDEGTLHVARFNADGSGDWVELVHGKNGLTQANGFDSQASVVMFARAAGDRVGATKMDRPEWIARHPFTADLYCTLTNNVGRGQSGNEGANPANPRTPNRYGHIVRWTEENGDHASAKFRWETFILAGDPKHVDEKLRGNINGDLFASPDGLMIDARGVIWVQTDVSPASLLKDDHAIYGNNQMLAVDPITREARRFLTGPRGCEITGGCMTPDGRTLFVNIQHPGEVGAIGTDPANPRLLSNWPDFKPEGRPRSATVVVRRADGGVVGS